jgi:hypothetical protein
MKAGSLHKALPAVLVVAVLGIAAPTAGATSFLYPTGHDFGEQPPGATSESSPFTLTVFCSVQDPGIPGLCAPPAEFLTPAVSTTGDFAQTNNCPTTLFAVNFGVPASCTINVTFTPSAAGPRVGTLTAGGYSSSLSGTGAATPLTTEASTFNLKAAIKKCKKKFPKGQKRKRCIKKAKALAG